MAATRADHAQGLRAVLQLQREIAAVPAGDRARLSQLVAAHSLSAFPGASGSIVLELAGGELRASASSGSAWLAAPHRVDLFGSLAGLSVRRRQTLVSDDVRDDPRVDRAIVALTGMASAAAAPLVVGDEAVGALVLHSEQKAAFDDADVDQLTLFADAVSGALRHWNELARYADLYWDICQTMNSVERSEAQFRAVFDNSPMGMAVIRIDEHGTQRFTRVNAAAAAMLGRTDADLLGTDLAAVLGDAAAGLVRAPGSAPRERVERHVRHRDGRDVWTRWHVAELPAAAVPAEDSDGDQRVLVQIDDITDRRSAVHALRRQARLLDLIPEPIIIRSPDGTVRYWNAGAEAAYGYPAAAAVGQRTHDLLHTDFVDSSLPDLERELDASGSWTGQLLHRSADGRTLRMASKHIYDHHGDGEPVILEINVDITERVAAERALAASETKFRAQFAHSTVGQMIRQIDGTIADVNPALAAMLGYGVDELIGTDVERLYDPARPELRASLLARFEAGETDAISMEGKLVRRDGSLVEVEANLSCVRNADGTVAQIVSLFHDITERKRAEQILTHRASHDPLTGLVNREQLGRHIDDAIATARRAGRSTGLLYVDLDGFKQVNDTFGHSAGDELLVTASKRLLSCVRDNDVVARIGGDEFVVLCTDLESAAVLRNVAERALTRLSAPYSIGGRVVDTVTASIGIAIPGAHDDAQQALQAADAAMYAAKHGGKGRIVHAEAAHDQV